MTKYTVCMPVTGLWSVTIEADNEKAAISKAQSIWEGTDTSQSRQAFVAALVAAKTMTLGDLQPNGSWAEAEVTETEATPS